MMTSHVSCSSLLRHFSWECFLEKSAFRLLPFHPVSPTPETPFLSQGSVQDFPQRRPGGETAKEREREAPTHPLIVSRDLEIDHPASCRHAGWYANVQLFPHLLFPAPHLFSSRIDVGRGVHAAGRRKAREEEEDLGVVVVVVMGNRMVSAAK